jgi:hypothetical protein
VADLNGYGEHRSHALTIVGGGENGSRVSATRVLRFDQHFLELRIVVPLTQPTERGRVDVAQRVLDSLVYAITAAIGGRP